MQNVSRTFTFGTMNALGGSFKVQEELACLQASAVNTLFLWLLLYFFPANSVSYDWTHSTPRHFAALSLSLRINLPRPLLQGETKAHSWYWRISVCLAVFLLFRCWTLSYWGYSNLKRFNYTSLFFGPLSFLLNTGSPIISAVKRGIIVHFEICIREACIIAACTSLNVVNEKVDWVHVG